MFFEEGSNVGDHAVLLDAAGYAGMDVDLVRELLASDRDKQSIEEEIGRAQQMGVTGVPFFIIANKYAISGAQPPEVLANAIRQISAEMKEDKNFTSR